MIRKILKKTIVMVLVLCLSVSMNISAATQVHVLTENPPMLSQVRGAEPPSSKADTHNLSISSYNYQVTKMGYRVYTSKWLTGATTIKVTAKNWDILSDFGGTSNKLNFIVFNSKGKEVKSKEITIYTSGSATFTGLTKSSKYYVCFEVSANTNKYAFNGTISAVS